MFLRPKRRERGVIDALCADARALLALGDDECISINEVSCGHAICGEIETIVLLMRPGTKTQSFCIRKPLAEVTRDDLAAVFANK